MMNALSATMSLMPAMSLDIGPFWPRRTPSEHKSREIIRFERHIFPKWKSKQDSYIKGEGDELSWVHAADLDIHQIGFQFRKSGSGSGALDRLKKGKQSDFKLAASGEDPEKKVPSD